MDDAKDLSEVADGSPSHHPRVDPLAQHPVSFFRTSAVVATVLLAACSDNIGLPAATDSAFRVVNASRVPIDVLVDGTVAVTALGVAAVSSPIAVPSGTHLLHMQSATAGSADVAVQTVAAQTVTAYAVSSATSNVMANVLADTGAIVPAGKSKLRVSNLVANSAAIEIWRTQPDFQTPVHIMTPFAYLATSPYLQSDPGAWEVFVTATGGTTKLATTGAVTLASGERITVVLIDSLGVLRFRTIP